LGVTRKLLKLWMNGKVSRFRLPPSQIRKITSELIKLKRYVPLEFSRKPRALQFLDTWKATEFRQFLLYTGPIALKSVLPKPHYSHFMCFHYSIYILCSESLYKTYNSYADSLLKCFVYNFAKLYGPEQVSYNIHGLTHLAADALRFGPLDNFSAFRFENHLGFLKRMLNSRNRPLEQIHNRIIERNRIQPISKTSEQRFQLKFPRAINKLTQSTEKHYSYFARNEFTIRTRIGDNACELTCGTIVKVNSVVQEANEKISILSRSFLKREKLYTEPSDSTIIGIYKVSDLSNNLTRWNINLVRRKCVLVPIDVNHWACFPLIHIDLKDELQDC